MNAIPFTRRLPRETGSAPAPSPSVWTGCGIAMRVLIAGRLPVASPARPSDAGTWEGAGADRICEDPATIRAHLDEAGERL